MVVMHRRKARNQDDIYFRSTQIFFTDAFESREFLISLNYHLLVSSLLALHPIAHLGKWFTASPR